jgi:hypothetical protein
VTAILKPFDRSAALVFFGAVGLVVILVAETLAAAAVLDQGLVDAFYGAVKTLVTVDPNPEVQDGPEWFKFAVSLSMLIALLFAAAFTGGLVERLIGRNLTGSWAGRRCRARTTSSSSGSGRSGCGCACCCASAAFRWSRSTTSPKERTWDRRGGPACRW